MIEHFLIHEAHSLQEVVMCCPQKEYFDVQKISAHNISIIANRNEAINQHKKLIEVIHDYGTKVLLIEELEAHPNSVFTRDTAITTANGYIKLRMGLKTRRGEDEWMSNFLEGRGIPCVGSIKPPGTAEGGDVVLAGNIAFVGMSSRTNKHGANQLRALLSDQGFHVKLARVPEPFLHIGGAMSIIAANTIISVEGVFPRDFFSGFKNIEVPNTGFITGNVITLGNGQLIANRENTQVIDTLQGENFLVHAINLSEFAKGTGGPSCLIMPLYRQDVFI